MTKKELAFIVAMNVVLVLINVIWALVNIETYIFIGICAWLPTIAFIKLTKEAINMFKTNKEI